MIKKRGWTLRGCSRKLDMKTDETCDMIHLQGDDIEVRCGRPAVARSCSLLTPMGRLRYCEGCLRAMKAWEIETEPIRDAAALLGDGK